MCTCWFYKLVTEWLCHVSARSDDERYYGDSHEMSAKTAALEELLASKLAEFLDSSFPYTLNQLSSAAKENLYKGPNTDQKGTEIVLILKTGSNFVDGLVVFQYIGKLVCPL